MEQIKNIIFDVGMFTLLPVEIYADGLWSYRNGSSAHWNRNV